MSTQLPGPGSRRCKLCPGGIYGSYGGDARINIKEGSFDWKLKVLVHFLSVKRYWRATSSLHLNPIFPNASNKNFKMAILLKIVQRSYSKNSDVDTTHQVPGAGVLSYALGAYMGLKEEMLVLTSNRDHLIGN